MELSIETKELYTRYGNIMPTLDQYLDEFNIDRNNNKYVKFFNNIDTRIPILVDEELIEMTGYGSVNKRENLRNFKDLIDKAKSAIVMVESYKDLIKNPSKPYYIEMDYNEAIDYVNTLSGDVEEIKMRFGLVHENSLGNMRKPPKWRSMKFMIMNVKTYMNLLMMTETKAGKVLRLYLIDLWDCIKDYKEKRNEVLAYEKYLEVNGLNKQKSRLERMIEEMRADIKEVKTELTEVKDLNIGMSKKLGVANTRLIEDSDPKPSDAKKAEVINVYQYSYGKDREIKFYITCCQVKNVMKCFENAFGKDEDYIEPVFTSETYLNNSKRFLDYFKKYIKTINGYKIVGNDVTITGKGTPDEFLRILKEKYEAYKTELVIE